MHSTRVIKRLGFYISISHGIVFTEVKYDESSRPLFFLQTCLLQFLFIILKLESTLMNSVLCVCCKKTCAVAV